MDIPFVTDTLMTITVTGGFKETISKDNPIRYFNRTFTIVLEGSGYCMKNEQVHVFPPTSTREKEALN
uniref:Nuclear transport factor 2 domain-containing protein n=1 Tax=Bracon brevicornis TaxID=1563983 RepID=A0A6V7JH14_9HYME